MLYLYYYIGYLFLPGVLLLVLVLHLQMEWGEYNFISYKKCCINWLFNLLLLGAVEGVGVARVIIRLCWFSIVHVT